MYGGSRTECSRGGRETRRQSDVDEGEERGTTFLPIRSGSEIESKTCGMAGTCTCECCPLLQVLVTVTMCNIKQVYNVVYTCTCMTHRNIRMQRGVYGSAGGRAFSPHELLSSVKCTCSREGLSVFITHLQW